MEYPLCTQQVTVYRKAGEEILRQVAEDCFFRCEDQLHTHKDGSRQERKFLLVMPGNIQRVFPGDRICEGDGPQVTAADWDRFLPVLVPGLVQVQHVKPFYWDGQLCHVEAE